MNELKRFIPKGTPKQHAWLTLVLVIGFIGFILIAGEEDTNNPMPLLKWAILKALGVAMFGGSIFLGILLDRKNLLPECNEDEED